MSGRPTKIVGYTSGGAAIHEHDDPVWNPNASHGRHLTQEELVGVGQKELDKRVDHVVPKEMQSKLLEWGNANIPKGEREQFNKTLTSNIPSERISGFKRLAARMNAVESVKAQEKLATDTKAGGGFTSWGELNRARAAAEAAGDMTLFSDRLAQTPMQVVKGGTLNADGSGRMVHVQKVGGHNGETTPIASE